MLIKTKKNYALVSVGLFCIFVSFLSFDKKTLLTSIHEAYEEILSLSPGFSTARNIFDTGGINKNPDIVLKIKSIIGALFKNFIFDEPAKKINSSETIKIEVSFLDYQSLKKDRENAIKVGYLANPTRVNAKILYKNKKYKAKIRLKGDLPDHWLSETRMSLRVKLKKRKTILGMNEFSVQKPRARQYPYEHAFENSLRSIGNLGATHLFNPVIFNGENWGIMNIEEKVSKLFLEKQKFKDSLIFRFSNDKKWLQYDKANQFAYQPYRLSDEKLTVSLSDEKRFLKTENGRRIYTYVLEERLKTKHVKLYKLKSYLNSFWYSMAWNNFHALSNSNSRHYFNPYTLKLELVTTDQGSFNSIPIDIEHFIKNIHINETYKQIWDHKFSKIESKNISNFSKWSMNDLSYEINKHADIFPLDAKKSTDIIETNIDLIKKNKNKIISHFTSLNKSKQIENLKVNAKDFLKKPSLKQSGKFLEHVHVRHYNDGTLKFYNLLNDQVIVESIFVDNKKLPLKQFNLKSFKKGGYEPTIIKTDLTGIYDNKITIGTSYKSHQRVSKVIPTLLSTGSYNPLDLFSGSKNIPNFIKILDNQYTIESGSWKIRKPLVINGNLTINSGVNLTFSKNSYLIVQGALLINGLEGAPVSISPSQNVWKGIYVVSNNGQTSKLSHTYISGAEELNDGILKLTGGVSFYGGSVKLDHVYITENKAEDALNIVKSNISVSDLYISKAQSDGFDCDFCAGSISTSKFQFIGGDALDFSGSNLKIVDTTIIGVKDKAFSVGEESNVEITNCVSKNSGVGIAVKDGSRAIVKDTIFYDYKLHAAMTYTKKEYFLGEPSLKMYGVDVGNGKNKFSRQFGSYMSVDNSETELKEVNVKKLYSGHIMKKK